MNNNKEWELQSVCCNTEFRTTGTKANPSFIMNCAINNIKAVKIKTCMMPLTFYTIDERNNKIYFEENNDGITLTATLNSGIYTSSTISAEIKSALDNAGALTYTVSYSATTNKLTISSTNFKFKDGIANAYYEMGITNDDINVPSSVFSPSEVIDLSGVKCINVVSNINAIRVLGKSYSILGSIVAEEFQNEISTFQDDGQDYVNCNISALSDISFNLYDHRFRQITPQKDYSITINFLTE